MCSTKKSSHQHQHQIHQILLLFYNSISHLFNKIITISLYIFHYHFIFLILIFSNYYNYHPSPPTQPPHQHFHPTTRMVLQQLPSHFIKEHRAPVKSSYIILHSPLLSTNSNPLFVVSIEDN